MGAIWLDDLERILRSSNPPGPIQTVDGWQTRANSHGGYEAMRGICIHHDAGGGSDTSSVNFQCFVDADKPNAALHVGRDGTVWIMAAGATNTQGLGGPIVGVPANQGNFQLIGIEQGNNGTGEPYPTRQQDATLWLCRTLVASYGTRYGFGADHVISHFEWAPARKNDPAGPSRWAPSGGRWDMNAFRADVALLPFPPPNGGLILTPEDKKYLDTKFAEIWSHVLPAIPPYGPDSAESRLNHAAVNVANMVGTDVWQHLFPAIDPYGEDRAESRLNHAAVNVANIVGQLADMQAQLDAIAAVVLPPRPPA